MNGRSGVVYLAGTDWDRVAATDRHLTIALAELTGPSLFVDPVVSITGAWRDHRAGVTTEPMGPSEVASSVTRLRVYGPPLLTRPGVFTLTREVQQAAVRRAVQRSAVQPEVVVLATPWNSFPEGVPGTRVLYLTDDWEAGAALLGGRSTALGTRLRREFRRADLACAVTPVLVDKLRTISDEKPVLLLPNGCHPAPDGPVGERPDDLPAGPLVGLVGQLNERIDLGVLERIAGEGMSLVMIGPLTASSPEVLKGYRSLFERDRVTWLGRRAPEDLHHYLPHLAVGITPYVPDAFNRASFPLKTLEYLAHGLPVVATDLPATRWLGSPLVDVADDTDGFVALVRRRYHQGVDPAASRARRALAGRHTWGHRAAQLLDALPARSLIRA